ncbi:MAG: sigma 54-interacting transcriptional regulator, partial [Proteobacteria bacterium]|nr:sigma 54-interacting transcriptional regulator [Pseudomonadota bacterium]
MSPDELASSLVDQLDGDEFIRWISEAAVETPAPLDAPSLRAVTEFIGHFQTGLKYSGSEVDGLRATPLFSAFRPYAAKAFVRLVEAIGGSVSEARSWALQPVDPTAALDRVMDEVVQRVGGQARTLDELTMLALLVITMASSGETSPTPAPGAPELRARMGRMYLSYLLNGVDFDSSLNMSRVGLRISIVDYLQPSELEACKRDHDAAAARLQQTLPELGWDEPVRKALVKAAIGRVVERWRNKAPVLSRVADASLLLTVRIAAQATHVDTVLLYGETGTGKESAAKAIHQLGTRATQPFKVINCGAITESLAEAALNGIAKGVASGVAASPGFLAEADGGTLFLDEIDKAPLSLQGALLRVMGSKVRRAVGTTTEVPVDVRFIVATNRDLPTAVASGAFLEDLYFRLNPDFKLTLPPLRERSLDDFSALWFELVRPAPTEELTGEDVYMQSVAIEQAVTLFSQREWPGNIRQL